MYGIMGMGKLYAGIMGGGTFGVWRERRGGRSGWSGRCSFVALLPVGSRAGIGGAPAVGKNVWLLPVEGSLTGGSGECDTLRSLSNRGDLRMAMPPLLLLAGVGVLLPRLKVGVWAPPEGVSGRLSSRLSMELELWIEACELWDEMMFAPATIAFSFSILAARFTS
jgi:hypothetical protein